MENPDPIDDEVIDDSEGEMGLEEEDPGSRGISSANSASQVSAFTLIGQFRDKTISSISAFTAGPSAVRKQTSMGETANNQPSDVDNFIGISSIADRAKTRQRNPNSSIQNLSIKLSNDGRLEKQRSNVDPSSDIIELTSDEDDDELSLRPSKPKTKTKTKPKPKFNMKDEPRDRSNDKSVDVFGTTEMTADKFADAIPRPRPRPLIKRSDPVHESTAPPAPLFRDIPGLPSSLPSASHGSELPVATSPVLPHLDTSYLPPSDPPLPTLTTIHDEVDLPRIETLPNLDFDGPLSSPSSLFSDLGDTTKKRKRTVLDLDIDELASDSDLGLGKGGIGAGRYDYDDSIAAQMPPDMLPPPPTFFAGSSSSIEGGGRILQPEPACEVVDLTMLPPTIELTGAVATKKAARAKKPRQKKGDANMLDEDKLDDDFNPTENNKRGKTKPKPKTKKSADMKARQGEGQGQVEVSIVSKPRAQRTKNKGKEKATAGNKDTFKSREFIDDSGDEEDLSTKNPAIGDTSPRTSTNRKGAHTSADIAPVGTTSSPLSKTLLEANTVVSPGNNSNPGKSTPSSLSNRMNKKRKSIIESDPEDEDEGEKDHPAVRTSAKKHKGNNGSNVGEEAGSTIYVNPPAAVKKGKRGKNVVLSDEDESAGPSTGRRPASRMENDMDEGTSAKEKAKGNKSKTKSKKTVNDTGKDDNDVYMEDHETAQEQQLAPEARVAKENAIPPLKPTAKMFKPDDRPNVESPGLFPSLHSRYEIAPRRSSLPMSELIRRANSIPGSPFATPHSRTSSSSTRSTKSGGVITYSPYLKSSRSVLSRIAPLHPNRRTPPPPPPPLPPKKKTKKELEMEEKWEEEMIDSLGGISEWTCLTDDEKKALRRAKWAKEMGDWDD